MSLLGTDACESVMPPTALSIGTSCSSVLLMIVTTFGNTLVLLAILIDPNKDLRTPFNYFVANLAVADLTVGLLADPLSIAFHAIEATGKDQPLTLGPALYVVYFSSCTASLFSLAALAVDRYIAITSPLRYRGMLNFFRALLVSLGIWVFSISLTCIYFKVGYNIYRFVFGNTAVVATFAVIVFTYLRIFKTLRAQVKQWDDLHESNEENHLKKQALKCEKKVTKTLVIVLALFIACYLPSCICIYIINLCSSCDCLFIHWIRDIQFVLVLINSAVNPIVYGWRLKSFRHAFKSILTCKACGGRMRSVSTFSLWRRQNLDVSTTTSSTNVALELRERTIKSGMGLPPYNGMTGS